MVGGDAEETKAVIRRHNDAFNDQDREAFLDTLAKVVEACPAARFLLLVEHRRQMAAVEAAAADTVLVEGTPAAQLLDAVRALLAVASDKSTEVKP